MKALYAIGRVISRILFLFLICVLPFIFVFCAWWYYPIWINYDFMFGNILIGKLTSPTLGEIGDLYGSLNTLFSGLAFAGVIISIVMQSAELKSTRKEMKEQGGQFEKQTEAMKKQVFESSFFNMLTLHGNISLSINGSTGSGFKSLFERLTDCAYNHYLAAAEGRDLLNDDKWLHESISHVYNKFMSECYSSLGHYFRYLYQVLKFVHESDLPKKDRITYINIIRAQLSNFELALLFINCLCYERSTKFKVLMEEYAFFEHLYDNDLNEIINNLRVGLFMNIPSGKKPKSPTLSDLKNLYTLGAYNYNPATVSTNQ
ncbi:hypothetical protein DBR07_02755 [Aeromonas sp. HMWF036]|uniref:putative phage abortive infection protein n=1 Tax=unclassified Aeromonas TaxID=257493 RepID=UPI000D3C18CC|nr:MULTISPECIES: putative phage abortive infection protein [unclassified Aeromonas]PTS80433.1 hypothetical protein DBR07_02755 [Aeromonas sp. HMWF036]PTT24720.1 hypothetical protein DBR30_17385 [Aeromonas sp. HMWF017]